MEERVAVTVEWVLRDYWDLPRRALDDLEWDYRQYWELWKAEQAESQPRRAA